MASSRQHTSRNLSSRNERVLVAVVNRLRDLRNAREQGWYRIPVKSAPKEMGFRWLAFYQTKVFGEEKWAVNYWAEVISHRVAKRRDLLPEEADHSRAGEDYYRLELGEIRRLARPIVSRRGRRIVFIPTILDKLLHAAEINDLFHDSPLEDLLWAEFKRRSIEAERQYYLPAQTSKYCLDFALFCESRKIDVECDGDTWHLQKDRVPQDNARNNSLASRGWSVLRFNTHDIRKQMPACIAQIRATINEHGGLITLDGSRRVYGASGEPVEQLSLFDHLQPPE